MAIFVDIKGLAKICRLKLWNVPSFSGDWHAYPGAHIQMERQHRMCCSGYHKSTLGLKTKLTADEDKFARQETRSSERFEAVGLTALVATATLGRDRDPPLAERHLPGCRTAKSRADAHTCRKSRVITSVT